jgi:hypothetical protein
MKEWLNKMRKLFDFRCEENHYTEKYIDDSVTEVECRACGKKAVRVISPVRSLLDPIKGDFPGATMRWAREHEKAATKSNP